MLIYTSPTPPPPKKKPYKEKRVAKRPTHGEKSPKYGKKNSRKAPHIYREKQIISGGRGRTPTLAYSWALPRGGGGGKSIGFRHTGKNPLYREHFCYFLSMLGPFLLRFFPYRGLFHRVKAFLLRSDAKSCSVCITITHANYNIPVTINNEMKTSSLFALIRSPGTHMY